MFWTSNIALKAILIFPLVIGLISGMVFVKQFMLIGHFFKSCLILLCFTNCAFYLSYEQPSFMWAYTIIFFLLSLVLMFTCFKQNKMEWMLSCAYSIQGLRLICCSILPNTLYGSLRTLNIAKVFQSDQMSIASWIFVFLVPSFALFRIMMIESTMKFRTTENQTVSPDTFAGTLAGSAKENDIFDNLENDD
jgi:hypothetical protein